MSRVSFFMLLGMLAMALAETTAHARSDLFHQLLSSKDYECQKIPFLLCDRVCDACVCDRRVPEAAECVCGKWKPFSELQKSEEVKKNLDSVTKSIAKSIGGFIPYPECIEKCDECSICTLPWPIETALCYCGMKPATRNLKM